MTHHTKDQSNETGGFGPAESMDRVTPSDVNAIGQELLTAVKTVLPKREESETRPPDAFETGYRQFVLRLLAYQSAELGTAERKIFLEKQHDIFDLLRWAISNSDVTSEIQQSLLKKIEILRAGGKEPSYLRLLSEFQLLDDGSPMARLENEINTRLANNPTVGAAYSYVLLTESGNN